MGILLASDLLSPVVSAQRPRPWRFDLVRAQCNGTRELVCVAWHPIGPCGVPLLRRYAHRSRQDPSLPTPSETPLVRERESSHRAGQPLLHFAWHQWSRIGCYCRIARLFTGCICLGAQEIVGLSRALPDPMMGPIHLVSLTLARVLWSPHPLLPRDGIPSPFL
jgi:hypothetical protein